MLKHLDILSDSKFSDIDPEIQEILIFDPTPIPQSFMEQFRRLPTELRHKIYFFACAWDVEHPYPRRGQTVRSFSLARKNLKPEFPPTHLDQYRFEHKEVMDYFKSSEYESIYRFISRLEAFEGRNKMLCVFEPRDIHDPSAKEKKNLEVLLDFVDWFWSEIVISKSNVA